MANIHYIIVADMSQIYTRNLRHKTILSKCYFCLVIH